jgi:hypothetical protein
MHLRQQGKGDVIRELAEPGMSFLRRDHYRGAILASGIFNR